VQERDEFRKDRAKERQRERNIARAAPDKRLTFHAEIICCFRFVVIEVTRSFQKHCSLQSVIQPVFYL